MAPNGEEAGAMGAADPTTVTTLEDLKRELGVLFDQARMSYNSLAGRAGLSAATLHDLINNAESLPRRDTVQLFVRACGENEGPWMQAWTQADRATPKKTRTSTTDLQVQLDAVKKDLAQVTASLDWSFPQTHTQAHATLRRRLARLVR
jgi:hypothetical protein